MTGTRALMLEETASQGSVRKQQQVILTGKLEGVVSEEAACERGVQGLRVPVLPVEEQERRHREVWGGAVGSRGMCGLVGGDEERDEAEEGGLTSRDS